MRSSPTCKDSNSHVRYSNPNAAHTDLLLKAILKHSSIVKPDMNTALLHKALWVLCLGLFAIDLGTSGS